MNETSWVLLVDTNDIANSLKESNREKKPKVLMPRLFNPKFIGRITNERTGKSYQNFQLKNLDLLGIKYKVVALDFGDYVFSTKDENGESIIEIWERKTVTDMLGSFTGVSVGNKGTKRLDTQITDCLEKGPRYYGNVKVVLLIEDFWNCHLDYSEDGLGIWIPTYQSYKQNKDKKGKPYFKSVGYSRRNTHPNAFLEKIRAIEKKGVEVVKCGGAQHAYKTLIDRITSVPEEEKERIRAVRRKPSHMKLREHQEFVMQGFDSIGPVLTKSMLEKHGTVKKVIDLMATIEDPNDMGVKGFGRDKLDKNKKILTSKYEIEAKKEG